MSVVLQASRQSGEVAVHPLRGAARAAAGPQAKMVERSRSGATAGCRAPIGGWGRRYGLDVQSRSQHAGSGAIPFRQRVGVAVECHRRLGMAMTLRHGADVHSGRQQGGHREVTEPVEMEALPLEPATSVFRPLLGLELRRWP